MVVATKAEKMKVYYGPGPVGAPQGTSFIIVNVTMTNGDILYGFPISGKNFYIVDGNNIHYQAQPTPFLFPGAFPYSGETLLPGQSRGGKIVFTVPDVASELDIRIFLNGQWVAWVLP